MSSPLSDGARALSLDECRALLERVGWGVLATGGEDGPYAVPVGYALAEDVVYLATGPGRKLDNLHAAPRVCLTVTEVKDFDHWRCVIVEGPVRRVDDLTARMVAVAAFLAQTAPRGHAPLADSGRLLGAELFSLSLAGMTGRNRGAGG